MKHLRTIAAEHWPIVLVVAIFVASAYAVERAFALPGYVQLELSYWTLNALAVCFHVLFLSGHAFKVAARTVEGQSAFVEIWRDLRRNYLQPRRAGGFVFVMLITPIFMSIFSSFKVGIPRVRMWDLDPTFDRWERALHFGRAPWEWLQPLLGHPYLTTALNACYNAWIFLVFFMILWQAWSSHRRTRARFLISLVLVWMIGGSYLATALSSAGPCFYALVVDGPDPYAAQMQYLHSAAQISPVWSLEVMDKLWIAYETGVRAEVAGISAMPSMHVATATLFALTGWAHGRKSGIALTVFCGLILIGSVHLAWHYALDGYVSVVMTLGIWWFAGRLTELKAWECGPLDPPPGESTL